MEKKEIQMLKTLFYLETLGAQTLSLYYNKHEKIRVSIEHLFILLCASESDYKKLIKEDQPYFCYNLAFCFPECSRIEIIQKIDNLSYHSLQKGVNIDSYQMTLNDEDVSLVESLKKKKALFIANKVKEEGF